ncbi:unnamed protein product [marine sediment metagenome]|uniref:Uncharacterized protein n=1 Tax=marine sediment metagenome TaxID=412755 RepID=X1IV28_9ZZZZ
MVAAGAGMGAPLDLAPGIYLFEIGWKLPSDIGNVVQGDSVTFIIEFVLQQGSYPE